MAAHSAGNNDVLFWLASASLAVAFLTFGFSQFSPTTISVDTPAVPSFFDWNSAKDLRWFTAMVFYGSAGGIALFFILAAVIRAKEKLFMRLTIACAIVAASFGITLLTNILDNNPVAYIVGVTLIAVALGPGIIFLFRGQWFLAIGWVAVFVFAVIQFGKHHEKFWNALGGIHKAITNGSPGDQSSVYSPPAGFVLREGASGVTVHPLGSLDPGMGGKSKRIKVGECAQPAPATYEEMKKIDAQIVFRRSGTSATCSFVTSIKSGDKAIADLTVLVGKGSACNGHVDVWVCK